MSESDRSRDYVEVYADDAGEKRWRYKAGNGEKMADSGEGYKNVGDLLSALAAVTGRTPTVVETKGTPTLSPHQIRVVML